MLAIASNFTDSSTFRKDFGKQKRMIFIAATDDVEWLKKVFATKTQDFLADDIYFSADLFSSVDKGAGQDLALLSLCNHSIISVICIRIYSTLIYLLGKYLWTVGSTAGRRAGLKSYSLENLTYSYRIQRYPIPSQSIHQSTFM